MRVMAIWMMAAGLSAGGCRGAQSFPAQQPGLRWTVRPHGEQSSIRHEHVALPFALDPDGTNGTATVLGYLKALEQRGARYVSDVSFAIQLRLHSTPIECVTQILPAREPDAAAAPPAPPPEPAPAEPGAEPEYETTIRAFQPGQVEAWVTDRDLHCKQEGVLVTGMEPKYTERTSAETARLWAPPESRGAGALPATPVPTSWIEWEDRCELRKVRRKVRRYDHFVATRFEPPDLGWISRAYSDWPLVEGAPACHPIEVPEGTPLQSRIEGEVYYTGELGKRATPKIFKN